MTTDLCTDDVVVRITAPQIISSEAEVIDSGGVAGVGGGAGGAGAVGARVHASSAAVELGRRLLLAARAGNTSLVLDLMAKGAPFTTDWLGTSALHAAAGGAHADTCAVLLRAGMSRDARTKVDRTPLHLAAYGGHADVARLLLEHGAAPDCRDMLRMTPLHWAAARGHRHVAAALLRHGADVAAVCKFGRTPRQLAARARHPHLLALLDAHPAPPPAPPAPPAPPDDMLHDTNEARQMEFSAAQRIQEVKVTVPRAEKRPIKTEDNLETAGADGRARGETAAEALLRRHGITLLPADDGSTVLSALQSGCTVVLSDAGKLMLKESGTKEASQPAAPTIVSKAASQQKGVVLTATPVRTPPKPGVKIFTINNKLLALPKDSNKLPIKKVLNTQDMQVVGLDATPLKSMPTPVRIVVNKGGGRLPAPSPSPALAPAPAVVPDEREMLRGQLRAARRAAAGLAAELAACRARLARYEPAAPH